MNQLAKPVKAVLYLSVYVLLLRVHLVHLGMLLYIGIALVLSGL